MNKLSLCCISLRLQEQGIQGSAMTKKRFLMLERNEALKIVGERTLNNIKVTKETIKYCADKGWNYRISSNLMPLETLPEAAISYDVLPNSQQIYDEFKTCAELIKKTKVRCSTHPDQYTVPASANPEVVKKSIIDLQCHGKAMDLFGLPQSYEAPINIHMNSYKGDELKNIAKRFIMVYNQLDNNVKSRLVLENEDKPNSWNVKQLYDYIYSETGIPITYDSLHYRNNTGGLTPEKAYELAKSTWGKFTPLFHFSDTEPSLNNPRAHADYATIIHPEFLNNDVIDLECEFKAKDYALEKIQKLIDISKK
jgi:UV DNA damage endonuclease